MMNRLSVRLSLAFLLSAWISIAAMGLVVQRTLNTGFRQYLSTRESESNPEQTARLESYFAASGSWTGAESVLGGRGPGSDGTAGRGAVILIADPDGRVQAATHPAQIGSMLSAESLAGAVPLRVDETHVGWLVRQSPGVQALGTTEVAFLNEANRWLTLAGVGATLLALIVGTVLAWTLARPLRELTYAVRNLSVGQLGQQVQAHGTREVKTLAAEFNALSRALDEAESLRQRMAADVAHELRTPVTVLRGHLEAMLDGVYPLDSAHIATAHDQTIHLARLVEDLRVLTLAEARRLPLEHTRWDPGIQVAQWLEAFEPLVLDGDIRLSRALSPNLPQVSADVTRIRQVLSNLLTNALHHTPSGGEITVQVTTAKAGVRFSVTNTGSTLNQADAARAFQPFWRAEAARARDRGGSGLGLAISREIIALHGGTIAIDSDENQVTVTFVLPAAV